MKGPKNEWREREQYRKRVKKVSTLKKYAKLVKREGLTSDRVHIEGQFSTAKVTQQALKENRIAKQEVKQQKRADQAAQQEVRKQQLQEEREAERKEKLKERKQLHKIMTQKTKKGQPVLAGRIKNILGKLLSEQQK